MIVQREKVLRIISNHLAVPLEAMSDDATQFEDLNADSLDCFEMVMELENAFDIVITDEEAEKVQTIGEAVALVIKKAESA